MRILFVFPEYLMKGFKPIGVSLLSASLKKRGHEVEYFDTSDYKLGPKYGVQPPAVHLFKSIKTPRRHPFPKTGLDAFDAFREKRDEFRPGLIAVSASYLQYRLFNDIFGKWDDRDIPVVMGGVHPTLNPEDVISNDLVDMICLGEGDDALVELVESLDAGDDRNDISNIWFKKNGEVVRNPMRPMISDMDSIPFVDWSLYPEHYFEKPYDGHWWRGGDLMSARGCYLRCNYCFYDRYVDLYDQTKNSLRYMTAERFIEELKYVYKDFGVNLIKVRDSDFFARPLDSLARMAELYEANKDELPHLLFNAYPGSVKRKKVELVQKMNCLSVGIGIESGNEEIRRKFLNRPASNDKFLDVVNLLVEAGIRVSSFNMMGAPTETRENVFETIELNRKANVDLADISILFPFPGTRIHDTVKEEGWLVDDWEDITYFRNEAVLDMPQLSQREMNGLIKVFPFYMNFPKLLWPLVRRAEKDDAFGKWLFKRLVTLLHLQVYLNQLFNRRSPGASRTRSR